MRCQIKNQIDVDHWNTTIGRVCGLAGVTDGFKILCLLNFNHHQGNVVCSLNPFGKLVQRIIDSG